MIESHNQASKPAAPNLSESAFRDIRPQDLPHYIKAAKMVVMEGLRRLLEQGDPPSEGQSFAFSLGTLSELERMVDRWRDSLPKMPQGNAQSSPRNSESHKKD